jgi:hypothetical protein
MAAALNSARWPASRRPRQRRCSAVARLVPALAASDDPQALRVARYLRVTRGSSFLLFPAASCPPGGCETCGSCQQDCAGCGECSDGGCDICLPATMTPRTAAVLGQALAVLADEAYDYIYGTGMCPGGAPGPLGAVPRRAEDQDAYARAAGAARQPDSAQGADPARVQRQRRSGRGRVLSFPDHPLTSIDPRTGLPLAQELRYLKLPVGQTWSAPDGLFSFELFGPARWTNATPPAPQ